MVSEIVFVKDRLNTMGCQKMLHDELLPFVMGIEDKREFLLQESGSKISR